MYKVWKYSGKRVVKEGGFCTGWVAVIPLSGQTAFLGTGFTFFLQVFFHTQTLFSHLLKIFLPAFHNPYYRNNYFNK